MKRIFFILVILPSLLFSQTKKLDSLEFELRNTTHDTTRCNILMEMLNVTQDYNQKIEYFNQIKKINETNNAKNDGLKKRFFIKLANIFNNSGMIASENGDIQKALDYFQLSIKISEEIRDKSGIALVLNNMGGVYDMQGDVEKGLEYYEKSLKIRQEIGDKSGVANCLVNIGSCYEYKGNQKKALEYFQKSLQLQEEVKDKTGMAYSLINIGQIYDKNGDREKALDYYQKSLKINEEIEDKLGEAYSLNYIASVMLENGQIKEALLFANKGLSIGKELGYPENISNSAKTIKKIYLKQKKYKEAFEMFELEIKMHDSINNQENHKAAIKKELQYSYEKKALEIKHEQDKKDVKANEEKHRQKIITYSITIGLVLVAMLALFILRGSRQKQKANAIITQQKNEVESQKKLIEEKHKEITDSINYAERIQRSFLATQELLNENLTSTNSATRDYFVFFQPKDVVSGDFYWATYTKASAANGKRDLFYLATADSTGHGVPGAIMSILNISSLEKSFEQGLIEPSEILNHTRKTIIERLKKDGSAEGGKDGMDASLVCFDFKNSKLTYSAAHNPVWIVRKEISNEVEHKLIMIELAPDKMPVGKSERDTVPFTQHNFDLIPGDVIYTLTDGMPDQFGGPKGKKFMYKQLKELLISISQLPMHEQKETLETSFNNWKGNLEQVDDICLIAVRI